uniref:START domain-containing protein n=1 Tax=Opuntia streptacantha TaxID=393608 RepID=A0A7C9EBC2_OPUST
MGEASLGREFWKENKGGGWAAFTVLSLIFLWQLLKFVFSAISRCYVVRFRTHSSPISPTPDANLLFSSGISELITEGDLKCLIDNLDEKANEIEKWENVTEKSKGLLSYKAKCCKPKDGPFKYLSVTVFGNCSPELLRDFYMDCEYRKQWDRTVVEHEQLQIDERTGIEIGRTIKKFPLLTHREYVLAWKVWEGSNKTYYCFTKECEHPLAPRQKKYVRVAFFRSGWRIRQVPGTNACEIKMVHQEDAGLNVELARLAFAKGVWGYVCKMEDALRKYSLHRPRSILAMTAVSLMQKVPPELEGTSTATQSCTSSRDAMHSQVEGGANSRRLTRKPSKKLIANGLLLLGGLICLSHGNAGLAAKVATAYILKKLSKRGAPSGQTQTDVTR